ncbi:MAG TPA: aminodeoxychorismate/anthranilate synthase component II [Gemmatimonadaceae bacterium]|nr:aminodeoxychorismate/anthranilate synthase component II [Gemmatimonadaceae bacterium]
MLLVLDNYDSFTYNIVQHLGELGESPVVRRNDEISVDDIGEMGVTRMVISPGPCTPSEAGITVAAIRRWGSEIPTLGICLGHQAIGEAFGGRVVRARKIMHGRTSLITHDSVGLFDGLPNPLEVMRYHSLVIEPRSMPPELEIVARSVDDPTEIHAIRHGVHPIWGVQFHPESILTQNGRAILRNFLTLAR